MNGAIGVAKYIATEERLKQLKSLLREQEKRERDMARIEQTVGHVLREEETACASYARRLQSCAEAKDSLQRMHRNPGVSFLGYESPAKRRITEMQKAIKEHGKAATVAKERYDLARIAGKRAREQLALVRNNYTNWQKENQVQTDARQLDLVIRDAQQILVSLRQTISEAEIDEAVMLGRVKPADAARVRASLRNRDTMALER